MDHRELQERLMQFALQIFRFSVKLPSTPEGRAVRSQLFRSATSPASQYREACRARSPAEFVSKMEACVQELDETSFWLEFIERSGLAPSAQWEPLRDETDQLIRIFTASIRTAKANR